MCAWVCEAELVMDETTHTGPSSKLPPTSIHITKHKRNQKKPQEQTCLLLLLLLFAGGVGFTMVVGLARLCVCVCCVCRLRNSLVGNGLGWVGLVQVLLTNLALCSDPP